MIGFARFALCVGVALGAAAAGAQTWPSKPIRWIVGYPPGGGVDTLARVLADAMAPAIGQALIIENRPGANSMIAAEILARAAPDGHTVMLADNGTLVNNAALYKKTPYDPIADLMPVSLIGRGQFVLIVNPATGIRTFEDLKSKVAANPGKYRYASTGAGSTSHIGMEMIKQTYGLKIDHIPYKGTAPAVQDVLSGQVEMMLASIGAVLPHVKANTVIAVASARDKRIAQLPNVPSLVELGMPGGDLSGWMGLVVPARTPEDIKSRLANALKDAIATPSVNQRLSDYGIELSSSTAAEMRAFQQAEIVHWHKFIKASGISLD